MSRKQQGGRARGKRSTPLHQTLPARDIAVQLRSVYTYLETVHSLVMVAGDALQAQAADNDTDVAAVLKHFAASSISTQMDRIKLLIALCDKRLSPGRRPTFRIPTELNTTKG